MPTRFAFKLDGLLDVSKAGLNLPGIGLQLAGASKIDGPVPRSRGLHCDGQFKGIARIQNFCIGYLKLQPSLGDRLMQDPRLGVRVIPMCSRSKACPNSYSWRAYEGGSFLHGLPFRLRAWMKKDG